MKYDVLTEPWVPVKDLRGEIREVGLYEALLSASEFSEITTDNPQTEFGLYRFLFTFLMDAFHPMTSDDLLDLLDAGSFDETIIKDYIEKCRREGVTFDLFDEKMPFLQAGADQWENKAEPVSIAKMNPVLPSGNNHVHFDHVFEAERGLSPAEALRILTSLTAFSLAGIQGYPSTVNGAPPIYTIIRGNNLFETLIFGMVPASEHKDYDSIPPVWRWKELLVPKKEVAETSLLFGLTFPCRKVRLMMPVNGMIKNVCYLQGLNYIGYEGWVDPYVSYSFSEKKGRSNLKPNENVENWRNIATIFDNQKTAPFVVRQYCSLLERKYVHVIEYSILSNQASYVDQQRNEYVLSEKIVKSSVRFDLLQKALGRVEEQGSRLTQTIDWYRDRIKRKKELGVPAVEKTSAAKEYYFECRKLFFEKLIEKAETIDLSEANDLLDQWEKDVIHISLSCYRKFMDRVCSNSHDLMEAERVEHWLFSKRGKE